MRIATVGVAAAAAAAVAVPMTSFADEGHQRPAAAASVDMQSVVKAAQIDPRRADDTQTPGAHASVLAVEQALQAKGMLAKKYVDGYFGSTTVTAYAKYQKSLGYSGLDASGLPGKASLQKLGKGRYTVTNAVSAGQRVTSHGARMNTRTVAMLGAAEKKLGKKLVIEQGSYNPGGDPTSAGAHDGGGVLDISVKGMDAKTRNTVARELRKVGFAAWVRDPSQADWPWHIHAVALGDTDLSSDAQHQAGDYYLGKNGLANRLPDDGPKVSPIRTWEETRG